MYSLYVTVIVDQYTFFLTLSCHLDIQIYRPSSMVLALNRAPERVTCLFLSISSGTRPRRSWTLASKRRIGNF